MNLNYRKANNSTTQEFNNHFPYAMDNILQDLCDFSLYIHLFDFGYLFCFSYYLIKNYLITGPRKRHFQK